MKTPLTNDFGVPIKKQVARDALKKAGWWICVCCGKYGCKFTLAEAWEIHKQKAVS